MCEFLSNKIQQHQAPSMAISSPSQILNIANTPYKQQADQSSINACFVSASCCRTNHVIFTQTVFEWVTILTVEEGDPARLLAQVF